MKKYHLFSLFALFLFTLSGCEQPSSLFSFDDFGAQPDSKENAAQAAAKLIKKLKNRKDTAAAVTVTFPKGRYDFYEKGAFEKEYYISNHDQDNPKKVGFALEDLNNVTIEGQGSEFIFHGRMIPISLVNSKNIQLKNFSIDFEVPAIRQIKVLQVNQEKNEMQAEIYPKGHYEIKNNQLVFLGESYKIEPNNAMVFRPDKRLAYRRADIVFDPDSINEVSPNKFSIKGWDAIGKSSVGERFVLRSYKRPTPGIFIDQSLNTELNNVTVHYAEGMGLLAQMSKNITLDHFNVSLRGEEDPRYFTTQADATHFSGCRGKISSKNGLYEGMADDAINVHGTYLKITKRVNDSTFRAEYVHPQTWGFTWGEPGDQLHFIKSETMELVDDSQYTLKSIKALDKPTAFGAKKFEITLDTRLPNSITNENKFAVENLSWTPEVVFAHNIIRNNRARGALFSTPKKVLVEDNTFDHTHGAAILLAGDANGWYETGASKEVTIRGNEFINALTANYQFTNAIISIYPNIPKLKEQKQYFHSGITIENNTFNTFDQPLLYAKSVDSLVFKDNKILHNEEFKPFHWNNHKFFFEHVNHIQIKNNQFEEGFSPEEDLKIDWSPDEAVQVEGNTTT